MFGSPEVEKDINKMNLPEALEYVLWLVAQYDATLERINTMSSGSSKVSLTDAAKSLAKPKSPPRKRQVSVVLDEDESDEDEIPAVLSYNPSGVSMRSVIWDILGEHPNCTPDKFYECVKATKQFDDVSKNKLSQMLTTRLGEMKEEGLIDRDPKTFGYSRVPGATLDGEDATFGNINQEDEEELDDDLEEEEIEEIEDHAEV